MQFLKEQRPFMWCVDYSQRRHGDGRRSEASAFTRQARELRGLPEIDREHDRHERSCVC